MSDGVINVLDINAVNPQTNLLGGLSGVLEPDRLIATVANGLSIVEINPATGLITNQFSPNTPAAGSYRGVGVVDDLIYLGSSRVVSTAALSVSYFLDIFNRNGELQNSLAVPYAISAFGGDDVGTLGLLICTAQFDIGVILPGGLNSTVSRSLCGGGEGALGIDHYR